MCIFRHINRGIFAYFMHFSHDFIVLLGNWDLLELDKSYYMGLYFLCFHRHNFRKFVNISPVIFDRSIS